MKNLLLILALFVGSTQAAPPTLVQRQYIANMAAQCRGVMGRAVCQVQNGPTSSCLSIYARGMNVFGVGHFTAAEYCEYAMAGEAMCGLIERNCTADYAGRSCRMARALWRQR